jgi:hypothetical protein
MSNPALRRSLNADFKGAGLDLRVIHLSPDQLETFDNRFVDLELQIDDDGIISPRPI